MVILTSTETALAICLVIALLSDSTLKAVIGCVMASTVIMGLSGVPLTQPTQQQQQQQSSCEEKQDIRLAATCYAAAHGIPKILFEGLIKQESGWNPNAVSPKNARGLTQLMPATAKESCGLGLSEIMNPHKNMDCGAKYLAKQLKEFGSTRLALCAYNAGPNKVKELGRCPRFAETMNYVSQIEKHMQMQMSN